MRIAISVPVLLMLATASAAAPDFTDTAQVVSATPIVERVTEQRQDCAPGGAAASQEKERSLAAPIVGGVAGAVLGHQVGRGSGKTAATAAGAIAGAVVGDRIANRPQSATKPPASRCRTVETQRDVVKGYTVVYRYQGRDITTTLPHDPGPTVRVGIGVLDSTTPAAAAPTATMMGSNVRDVSPAGNEPTPPSVPASANPISNPGGYNYRY